MRSLTTLILLVAVLLLGGYIALVERRAEQQDRRQERARRALRFEPSRVTSLRVATAQSQVALEKESGVWRLIQPVQARADAGEVARILDTLESLVRSDVITGRQQREQNLTPEDFGFAQPRARVSLRESGRDMTLLVGRDTPLGGNMFVKVETERSIFVASTNLLDSLPRNPADLRERQVFLGFPGEVTRLDIRRTDGLLQLARNEQGVWRMQKPHSGRAAYAGIQQLLDRLFETRVVEFVADTIAAASLYGLDEPAAQITLAGSRTQGEQALRLGRTVEGRTNEVYATLDGTEHVFTVPATLLDAASTSASNLRDRRLLTMAAFEIGFVKTEEGERAISLLRGEDGRWSGLEPRQFKASEDRLQEVLGEWTGLRIETFIDNPGTNLALWGLSPPARRITFARRPPAPPSSGAAVAASASPDDSLTILVAREEQNGPDLMMVKVEGEESLFRVSREALSTLPMDTLHYRDPVVLSLDPAEIRSLTRKVAGQEQTVERSSTTQEFRSASTQLPDAANIGKILETLKRIKAVRFIMEDPETLDLWGLAEPVASLAIGLSGTGSIGKALVFGDDDGDGQVFAMVRGQGVVFTLSQADRDILLAPLHQRKPEPAPSAPAIP